MVGEGEPRSRSRSRSGDKKSRSEDREERRRRRRTGWDAAGQGETASSTATTTPTTPSMMPGLLHSAGLTPTALTPPTSGKHQIQNAMARIYVGSLDYHLGEPEIKQVFQAFGQILYIDMPKEGDRSKGFCFIEYAKPEAATMALSTMQGFVLKGRTIKVGRPTAVSAMGTTGAPGPAKSVAAVTSLSTGSPTPGVTIYNRVYIGNVPLTFSAEDLKKIFAAFGTINSCQLIPSPENPGVHRGYGFIEFAASDQAKLAIEIMNGFAVAGKHLRVNYATALRSQGGGPNNNAIPNPALAAVTGGGPPPGAATGANAVAPNLSAATMPGMGQQQMGQPQMGQPQMGQQQQIPMGGGYPGQPGPGGPPMGNGTTVGAAPGPQSNPALMNYMQTNVLLLTNMVLPHEVDDDLKEEVHEECSNYGSIQRIFIRPGAEEVRIFVVFSSPDGPSRALPTLLGRWFGGKQIQARYYDPSAFAAGNYDL